MKEREISIIKQVDSTYEKINSLTKTVKIKYADGTAREYNVFFKKPFKAKIEFISPPEEKGFNIWVYEDGIWHINEYNEKARTLNSFDLRGRFEGFEEFHIETIKPDLKRLLIKEFNIDVEEDVLNGNHIYKLTVTRKIDLGFVFKKSILYIDQETFLILKSEQYYKCPEKEEGCLSTSIENLNLKVNAEINDETFDIRSQNIPEGVVTVHEPFPIVAEEKSKTENEICIPGTTLILEIDDVIGVDVDNNRYFVRIVEIKDGKVKYKVNNVMTNLLAQGESDIINEKFKLLVLDVKTTTYKGKELLKVESCFIR